MILCMCTAVPHVYHMYDCTIIIHVTSHVCTVHIYYIIYADIMIIIKYITLLTRTILYSNCFQGTAKVQKYDAIHTLTCTPIFTLDIY